MSFQRRKNYLENLPKLQLNEAKKKIMDYVAKRDHSEKELRQKLALRCLPETIDHAILWAQEQNWLVAPEILKEKLALQLGRRGQGIRKINQKLKNLGLESMSSDSENELEKAKRLVLAKWSPEDFKGLEFKDLQKLKAKIMRFLIARGYESHVASSIIKTEFKTGARSYDEEY